MTQPGNCYQHPHAVATDACPECDRAICEYCLTPAGDAFLCPACAGKAKLRRRTLQGIFVVAVLAAIGIAGWLVSGSIKGADTGKIAKGQRKSRLTSAELKQQELAQDLCDEKKYRGWVTEEDTPCEEVLARAHFYFDQCGPFPRLRWSTYGCYKRLGQWDAAIAEVTRLIEQHPHDKDFRWWRGELHFHQQRWDQALTDYWQSVMLVPQMRIVPFELLAIAKKAERPCRGVYPMLQHEYKHEAWTIDDHAARVRRQALQACPATLGTGSVTGPTDAGHSAPPLQVTLNGKVTGEFSLDMETGLTLISGALARKLGLPAGVPFEAWYGYRLISGRFVILDQVAWGTARAKQVEALIVDGPPFFTDGVLGRTFLLRFSGRYNPDRTELTLTPRVFAAAPTNAPDAPDADEN